VRYGPVHYALDFMRRLNCPLAWLGGAFQVKRVRVLQRMRAKPIKPSSLCSGSNPLSAMSYTRESRDLIRVRLGLFHPKQTCEKVFVLEVDSVLVFDSRVGLLNKSLVQVVREHLLYLK
jgi:hypothetical protein